MQAKPPLFVPPPPLGAPFSKVLIIGHARPLTRTTEEEEGGVSRDAEGVLSGEGRGQGTQQHPYFSVMVTVSVSSKVWSALSASPSVVAAGEEEWQTLRIKQGETKISHNL